MKWLFEFLNLESFSPYNCEKRENQRVSVAVGAANGKVILKNSEPVSKIMLDPVTAQKYATAILMKVSEAAEEICKKESEKGL